MTAATSNHIQSQTQVSWLVEAVFSLSDLPLQLPRTQVVTRWTCLIPQVHHEVHHEDVTDVTRHHDTVQDATTHRHIVNMSQSDVSTCLDMSRSARRQFPTSTCRKMLKDVETCRKCVPQRVSHNVSTVIVPSPGPVALPPRLDLSRLADPGLDIT